MQKRLASVFSVFVMVFALLPITAHAQTTTHFQMYLHGTEDIGESRFGISAWVDTPSLTDDPNEWTIVAGPRYNGNGWWVEYMAGFFVADEERIPLMDIQASFEGPRSFTAGANLEWIDFTNRKESSLYTYFQVDYGFLDTILNIGVETENTFTRGEDVLSVGPHLEAFLGDMKVAAAYQLHRGPNQLWLRLELSFGSD